MRTAHALAAAGTTDAGLQREVNEDRFHVDAARGFFTVIDGIGGQAAGGKAADVALEMLRNRLERETGPTDERVREAITIANNEIYRLSSTRPEWNNMACVLTVAVVDDGHAIVGHVGDTRLYKIRNGGIEKITRDHSPVGEREDAQEISESDAMRHPRRNEIYRDVGSEPHQSDDPEFVDVQLVPFESDAALLLCSDGLTDLVPSAGITEIIQQFAGDPQAVARELVAAANEAGGKDNVTVVYVEGEEFAPERTTAGTESMAAQSPVQEEEVTRPTRAHRSERGVLILLILLLGVLGLVIGMPRSWLPLSAPAPAAVTPQLVESGVVRPGESITAAVERARPGSQVIVEPGEYREQLRLKDNVRVVSRVPRGATIRLPASASEAEPAVFADTVATAALVGFRIVGDAATPLGVGLFVRDSGISIVDVEITGATRVAIDISGRSIAGLIGSDIHDNPGAALAIRAGATPRISQNTFARNSMSERALMPLIIERGAAPTFLKNVFYGISPDAFASLDDESRQTLAHENWFVGLLQPTRPASPSGSSRRGQ
jgi:serine/threonine protein phosphatase PrpC